MRVCKSIFAVGVLVASLVTGGPVHAAIIEYIFSGTFTGSLGSTPYTNQAFTTTLVGDTGAVTTGGGEFSNLASSATFAIGATAGSLLGAFNDVVLNPTFGPGVGAVIFGQGQSSSPFFVGEGLSAALLASYDLTTAFPLTSGSVSQTPDSTYLTSDGNLVFSDISSLSFQAKLSPVPLPSSLPLFASGLCLMGLLGWHSKQKASIAKKLD